MIAWAKELFEQKYKEKAQRKNYNFRLVSSEVCYELTKCQMNGVTPFLLRKDVPIIISDKISLLDPQFFWLGGGHELSKIRISLDEFK